MGRPGLRTAESKPAGENGGPGHVLRQKWGAKRACATGLGSLASSDRQKSASKFRKLKAGLPCVSDSFRHQGDEIIKSKISLTCSLLLAAQR